MNLHQEIEEEQEKSFPEIEKEILSFWKKDETFLQTMNRDSNAEYVFYDGPPFANGLPHYGHLLTGFIKDTIARYQTMNGKKIERKFGWDCHGLPAEMAAEKELAISGKKAILEFGVDKFNQYCRESVMKYESQWEEYVTRQARWVDFKNGYKTMDINFMESVIWAFKELYKKGLIYECMRVVPYSWACQTPLSNFETKMDNSYREKNSKAVTVKFKLDIKTISNNIIKKIDEYTKNTDTIKCEEYYILAWTTTPWTLPSNLALAIGKDISYTAIITNGICEIASSTYFNKDNIENHINGEYTSVIIETLDLIGIKYEPLFPYFNHRIDAFQILDANFVTDIDGTGIVHVAPGFGEDDFNLCKQYGIELVCPVDDGGCFTDEIEMFKGSHVFECETDIIIYLKNNNSWCKTENYVHNYPHCWRTDTPLIYKAVSSIYVNVESFRDRMVELNNNVNWIPNHIKNGIFGKWLSNAKDWSISRNRFWGTPIPIWKSNNDKYPRIDVYGSIAELEKDFNTTITDLHKDKLDILTRINPDDPTKQSMMVRIPEVFDCWFESGSMPYAQKHYPFENKEWFLDNFPADFITEYIGQTRGWFYTLFVLSVALFDKIPFKNCICHGIVLDATGSKLSKRLNNYPDPKYIFEKYGSDALRFLMLSSPVSKGGDILLDKDGKMVYEIIRLVVKPIWSAYNFFKIYTKIDKIDNFDQFYESNSIASHTMKDDYNNNSSNIYIKHNNDLDMYISTKTKICIHEMKKHFDMYDITSACKEFISIIDSLNNWYIRRSRERFWKHEFDTDKFNAYKTLYNVLTSICKAVAPLLPLLSEKIWLDLSHNSSVHLQYYQSDSEFKDVLTNEVKDLIRKIDNIRLICQNASKIRNHYQIRNRQPLSELTIYGDSSEIQEYINIIKDEINVKNVIIKEEINNIANFEIKINFPIVGKKYPKEIKMIVNNIKNGMYEVKKIDREDYLLVSGIKLNNKEFSVKTIVKKDSATIIPENGLILDLNLKITEELAEEGHIRDLIRTIQNLRKQSKLHIVDKIYIKFINTTENISSMIKKWKNEIKTHTLAENIVFEGVQKSDSIDINGFSKYLNIQITKI